MDCLQFQKGRSKLDRDEDHTGLRYHKDSVHMDFFAQYNLGWYWDFRDILVNMYI